METGEALRRRVQHEQRFVERLQTANRRFADAQLERMWAIKSAHHAGLSIRQIAAATGLSASRIHQVLNTEEPEKVPGWVMDLVKQQKTNREGALLLRRNFYVSASIGSANWNAART